MKRFPLPGTITAAVFCILLSSRLVFAERRVVVGVVTDGPARQAELVRSAFVEELNAVTENEFQIVFPSSKQVDGQWSATHIAAALDQLENDKQVDIVLTLGFAASQQAATRSNLPKPTFAPFVVGSFQKALPRKGNSSGIRNLNYLTTESRLKEQTALFRQIVPSTSVVLLLDETLYETLKGASQEAIDQARQSGLNLQFVTNAGESDVLAKVPADVQGVFVAPLPRMNADSRKAMIDGLLKRKLPSFSLLGDAEVAEGLLMTDVSSTDLQRRARQAALNIHAVLKGEPAGDQPVLMERKVQVTINMATARTLGVSPSWAVMREAVLLNENEETTGSPLSLSEAVRLAVRANLSVIAGQLGVQAGQSQVSIVRSVLFPQITANVNYSQRKSDYPVVESGLQPKQKTTGDLTLNQVIFSESALANLTIQKRLQLALEAQQRGLELDIANQAANTFLSILRNQSNLAVQQYNLKLAQENLRLAKSRVELGKADISDVSRYESQIATTRQSVLAARSRLEQSRDQLNRLLNRKLSDRFPLQPPSLSDPILFIGRPEFLETVANERAYRLMTQFFVNEGLGASPDIAQLNDRVSAQERQLKSNELNLFLPDLNFTGVGSRTFKDIWAPASSISLSGLNDWQFGVGASLPILEGGRRIAAINQAKYILQQLGTDRDAVRQSVEASIRYNLEALQYSYPSIRLSKEAADAARTTLQVVTKNYARGTKTIVDLLDAQNTSVSADQTAASAVYVAMTDLMNLQRGLGQYDFFVEASQQDERMQRLKAYIASGGNQ